VARNGISVSLFHVAVENIGAQGRAVVVDAIGVAIAIATAVASTVTVTVTAAVTVTVAFAIAAAVVVTVITSIVVTAADDDIIRALSRVHEVSSAAARDRIDSMTRGITEMNVVVVAAIGGGFVGTITYTVYGTITFTVFPTMMAQVMWG
jgi:hypothetical protein